MQSMTNIIKSNIIPYLDWQFLDGGGFININIPSSGISGGQLHKLYNVADPSYSNGQVWQSHRNNWVWESGTTVGSPISISGLFVNNSFIPIGSGYNINYKSGRVVFNTPISTSSNIYIARSHKWIDVQPSIGHPWFREIQKFSNNAESPQLQNSSYGSWAQFGNTRVQLPSVLVNVTPAKYFKPFELGGGQYGYNDIIFTVLSETDTECVSIIDNISYNNDKLIYLYDVNEIATNNDFPLNINGSLNISPKTYKQLINLYSKWFCYIHDMGSPTITELSPGLYMATIRCTTETKPI
jgi:hypothetical protein